MASNIYTTGIGHPSAIRSKKLNGQRHSLYSTSEFPSGAATASAQRAPHEQESAPALVKYRRRSKPALNQKHEIEILTERNASLRHELIELTGKEAQARHLAYHDGLTGLPNRNLLQDRFHQAISQANRSHKPLALLLLDLDEFKRVNDKLGNVSGDKLLKALAERLSAGIRGADTACRYGGDEFVLMLSEIDSSGVAASLAVEIGTRLRQPYVIDDYEIHISVSVGTAVYPIDGITFDALMKQAEVSMALAKDMRSNVSIFAVPKDHLGEVEIREPDESKGAEQTHKRGPVIHNGPAPASEPQVSTQEMNVSK